VFWDEKQRTKKENLLIVETFMKETDDREGLAINKREAIRNSRQESIKDLKTIKMLLIAYKARAG
jgi:hypothetical protein